MAGLRFGSPFLFLSDLFAYFRFDLHSHVDALEVCVCLPDSARLKRKLFSGPTAIPLKEGLV